MSEYNDDRFDDGDNTEEFELSKEELNELRAEKSDKSPNPELEEKIVNELFKLGVLKTSEKKSANISIKKFVLNLAASLVILVTGFLVGHWTGSSEKERVDEMTVTENNGFADAASLQQASSNFLYSLEKFIECPVSPDTTLTLEGREIAIATLFTTVDQVTKIVPKDQLAEHLLAVIENVPLNKNDFSNNGSIKENAIIEF